VDIKDDEIEGKTREARTFFRLGIVTQRAGPKNSGKFYTLEQ
jgi:hypothetical protein